MNWYKLSQKYPGVNIGTNEVKALEEMGFLPQIPSNYKGFYYLLPTSQLGQDQKEAWKQHAAPLYDVNQNLYNNIIRALDGNTDLSIVGVLSGGDTTRQHENVHERMQDTPAGRNLEMLFKRRDSEEIDNITRWLTKHGYNRDEVPSEYYAYVLTQPELMQTEQYRLTQDEFRELRSLGLNVPEEAKRPEPEAPRGGLGTPAPTMPTL